MIRSTSEKGEKNTNFPILSRILFIDLFLPSFKYIRIVFFFFCFHSEQILIFAGVQWDLFQSTQRSAIFVSITTILYQKRTFFSSFVWEREKSSRERIIPLTDNNFSLKSLIFLTNISILGSNISSNQPPFVHALVSSPRDDRISSFFHWINAKVLCEREKRVYIYIYIKSRRRKDRNSRHVPRSFQGGNRTRHS